MRDQKPKYIVPDDIKQRVQDFMNEFMETQKLTKAGLARILEERLGRSGCRTNLVKKFSKATFQLSEVMEIADLFGYELKFVPKDPDRGTEKGELNK
jgi:hypothetical protein